MIRNFFDLYCSINLNLSDEGEKNEVSNISIEAFYTKQKGTRIEEEANSAIKK